jgi:hypothetical protein
LFQGEFLLMRIHLAPAAASLLAVIALLGPAWAEDAAVAKKVAKTKKPPSVCVGLDESACGTKSVCYWRKAAHLKSGKTRRAHCRIKRSALKSAPT